MISPQLVLIRVIIIKHPSKDADDIYFGEFYDIHTPRWLEVPN